MNRHKHSIEALLNHKNEGVLNCVLCLFDSMLSNESIVRHKKIDLITTGYTREIQESITILNTYSIMNHLPINIVLLCCSYYEGPPQQYIELLPTIIKQLKHFAIDGCDKMYTYYLASTPWTQIKLLKILRFFDAPQHNRETLQSVLGAVLDSSRDNVGSQNFNHATIHSCILFETIDTCTHYYDTDICLDKAQICLCTIINGLPNRSNFIYSALKSLNKMMLQEKKHNDLETFATPSRFPRLDSTMDVLMNDRSFKMDPIIKKEVVYVVLNILNKESWHSYFPFVEQYMMTDDIDKDNQKIVMKDVMKVLTDMIRANERILSNDDMERQESDPFSQWDDINDNNINWVDAKDSDRKYMVGHDLYILQSVVENEYLKLKAINIEHNLQFIAQFEFDELKEEFMFSDLQSIREYIIRILNSEHDIFKTDRVEHEIGYILEEHIENKEILSNMETFSKLDMNQSIDHVVMIWRLKHLSDFNGNKEYNLILKPYTLYSVSEYIERIDTDIDIHCINSIIQLSGIAASDLITQEQMDEIMDTLSKSPSNIQLYTAAKMYDVLSKNTDICHYTKLIELAAHILLKFGYLLMHRFRINIINQFEHLNKYKAGADSLILSQLYDAFTMKYPESITQHMITQANIKKQEEEEEKIDPNEFLSLKINDTKGNTVTTIEGIKVNDTLQTLKGKITEIGGYKVETQMLYVGDRKLSNDLDDLTKHNINDGDTLQLVIKYGGYGADENTTNDYEKRKKRQKMNVVQRTILEIKDEISCDKETCAACAVLLFILLVLFSFSAGVDVAAMVIASEKANNNNKCALLQHNEPGGHLLINPSTFLMIGGIVGFINAFLSCCALLATAERIYDNAGRYIDEFLTACNMFNWIVLVLNGLIAVWCIVGFVEYSQLGKYTFNTSSVHNSCAHSMIGEMILSWCIIKLVTSCCCVAALGIEDFSMDDVMGVFGYCFDDCTYCNKAFCRKLCVYGAVAVLCASLMFMVDIVALIISSSSVDDQVSDELFIDPITFLQIGGSFGLFNSLRICCIKLQIDELFDTDTYRDTVPKRFCLHGLKYIYRALWISYDVFTFSWCVVGTVLFVRYNIIYESDHISRIIISWCIIKVFGELCFGSCLLNGVFDPSEMESFLEGLRITTAIQRIATGS